MTITDKDFHLSWCFRVTSPFADLPLRFTYVCSIQFMFYILLSILMLQEEVRDVYIILQPDVLDVMIKGRSKVTVSRWDGILVCTKYDSFHLFHPVHARTSSLGRSWKQQRWIFPTPNPEYPVFLSVSGSLSRSGFSQIEFACLFNVQGVGTSSWEETEK